jgi:hypothetical protein
MPTTPQPTERATHRVNLFISEQLHQQLLAVATNTGETLSGVIRRAMVNLTQPPAHKYVDLSHLTTEQQKNVKRLVSELSAALDPDKDLDGTARHWVHAFDAFEAFMPEGAKLKELTLTPKYQAPITLDAYIAKRIAARADLT